MPSWVVSTAETKASESRYVVAGQQTARPSVPNPLTVLILHVVWTFLQTLKILHSLSPELIALQLGRIVSLLASSSSSSPGVRAQEASVGQALEIIELTFASVDQEDGAEAAGKVWEVLEATHSADATEIVLEESAGRLLAWVGHSQCILSHVCSNENPTDSLTSFSDARRPGPTLWQASFSSSLLVLASASARRPSPTSSIVIAAAACEFNASTPGPADTSRLLASLLQGTSSGKLTVGGKPGRESLTALYVP